MSKIKLTVAIMLQTYPWEKTPGNDTYPDVRADAGRSYYYPYQDRANLHMMSGTTALNLLWAPVGDEDVVASAVKVITDSGETLVINATQEIILAAGTYRTPALLEYSGVGNPRLAPSSFTFMSWKLVGRTNKQLEYCQNSISTLR